MLCLEDCIVFITQIPLSRSKLKTCFENLNIDPVMSNEYHFCKTSRSEARPVDFSIHWPNMPVNKKLRFDPEYTTISGPDCC